MSQQPKQLSVVTNTSTADIDAKQVRPVIYCWTIFPEMNPHLSALLKKCPRIQRQSKGITEERVKPFFSTPIPYRPQEIPVVAYCLNRPSSAEDARKFRNKPNGGNLFHSILFDLFLSAFAAMPEFFTGKKVVDIDTVLILGDDRRMIPYVDGTAIDKDQGVGFDLLLAPYDQVWPADAWFMALTARAPRNPSRSGDHLPIFVEIDE